MSENPQNDLLVDLEEPQHSARGADRQSLFMHGDLTLAYMDAPQTVRIRNLSATGVMVETALPVQSGEAFLLELPNVGPVRGRVAWAREGRFGAAFDSQIDPLQVRRKIEVTTPASEAYVDLGKRAGRPGFAHLNKRY